MGISALRWNSVWRHLLSVDYLSGVKFISFFEPEAHQGSGTVAKNYYVERVVVMEKTIRSEAKIIVICT